MHTLSDFHADEPVLVWDWPVRICHWLLVLCFAGAYLTSESDDIRLIHVTLGYTMAGLLVFRLVWGLMGTRHARFADFVRGPAAAIAYLRALSAGQRPHFAGHNPAGGLAILALLLLGAAVTASGWATYHELGEQFEDLHEALANVMLALVVAHVTAVIVSSWLHRENLVAAMLHGRKRGAPGEGIVHTWPLLGLALLLAVLAFWYLQWQVGMPTG